MGGGGRVAARRARRDDGRHEGFRGGACGAPVRRARPDVDAARQMLAELGRALEVAILVHDVEGDGPVTLRGTILHGSDGVDVTVEAASETEALVELGRRTLRIRGADEAWIRRYGLGMG